jgi:ABC-type glycerol-3-phosphate transport system substrate-binding protein
MKKFNRLGKLLFIILLAGSFTLSGCSLKGCQPGSKDPGPSEPLTIDWWGTYYDHDYFSRTIERFEDKHDNVTINYSKKNPETYEEELVDALAANQGPDIAMIENNWFVKHRDKLSPIDLKEADARSVRDAYLPVVTDVVMEKDTLYGLPIGISTLGLYYNEDIFDQYRIRRPPTTWSEFNAYIRKITKRNGDHISQAGAAIGTSNNIDNSEDILLTLMLQNGTSIASSDRQSAAFNLSVQSASGEPVYTGRKALQYYSDFGDPGKDVYTWSSKMGRAWELFAEGKVAMIFDYYSRASDIYNRNPNLDFEFARVPQIENAEPDERKVIAKFWFQAVTNNAENKDWTWRFVQHVAGEMASSSLKEKAQRDERETQGDDIFVGQGLIAKTVYKGKSPDEFNQIFQAMINNIVVHGQEVRGAIDSAAAKVTEIYRNSI